MSIISRLLDIENEMDNFGDDFAFGSPMFGHTSSGPRLRRNLLPMLFSHGRRRHSPYSPSDKALKRIKFETPRASIVGKDGFEICINVEQFEPHEVTVKTIDSMVVVEGKHEEREDDHGYITRHFIRRYPLPKDYDPEKVVSTLSSDGFLTVKAPPPKKENEVARVIQIQHTGRLHSDAIKDKHDDDSKSIEDCDKNGGDQDKMEN